MDVNMIQDAISGMVVEVKPGHRLWTEIGKIHGTGLVLCLAAGAIIALQLITLEEIHKKQKIKEEA